MAVKKRGGSWQVDLTLTPPGETRGHRHRPMVATEAAGKLWEAQARADSLAGRPIIYPELSDSGQRGPESSSGGRVPRWAEFAAKTHAKYWKALPCSEKNLQIVEEIGRYFKEDIPLARIDADALDGLMASFINRGNSNSTINKKLAVVSRVVRFAHSRGHLAVLPRIERTKVANGRIRYFSPEEEATVLALMTQWGKADHHDAICTLIDTAVRPGELFRLKGADVDTKARTITLWKTKNDMPRTIYMTDRVRGIIERRKGGLTPQSGNLLFPYDNNWMRGVWDRVRGAMKLYHDKNFVPYVCRHTWASRAVQRGVSLMIVKEWLGHKSITMTLRYAFLCPTNLQAAIETPSVPLVDPEAGMMAALNLLAKLGMLPAGVTPESLKERAS